MPDKQSPYLKGAIWIGLLFIFAGAGVFFGVVTSDFESIDDPLWLPIGMSIMFINAGIVVGLMDTGFNEVREKPWFSYLHAVLLLSIPLIFTAILNWVAFGPGEREFSGGISIPFFDLSFGNLNAIFGRVIFGIPALILDFIILFVVYQIIKATIKKFKPNDDGPVTDEVESEF